jgi:hypothetical protein
MKVENFKTIFIVLLLLAGSFINSCKKENTENTSDEAKKITVVAGNPVKKRMVEYLELNATTTFQKQEIVRATFQGFIEKTYKSLGDEVKKGDLLFKVKTKEASVIDSMDLNSVSSRFSGLVNIFSRTSGILTELTHQTGDYISESDQLAIIVEPQSLRILVNVPFQYAKLISIYKSFSIRLPDGSKFEAKVINKVPSIDPVNQTQTFILIPDKSISIPENLNLVVKIPYQVINEAVALPKSAVLTNETQTEFWIMKVLNDSVAVKQDIEKGIEADSMVQIIQPILSLNDKFIFEGGYGLPDTAYISIKK